MTETQAREEICRVGKSLFDRGYVHATAGNISVRLDDGFLITPTDACLGFLDPAKLARLDASGQQLSGERASKTIALHTAIYGAAGRFDLPCRDTTRFHRLHAERAEIERVTALGSAFDPALMGLTKFCPLRRKHRPIPYRSTKA